MAMTQPSAPSAPSTTTSQPWSATCTTATPGKYGNVPVDACNSYYNFDPRFVPAAAAAAIFGLLTVTHVIEAFLFRKRYAWVLIMGAVWETAAFVTGTLGAHDQQNQGYATAHQLLFLLAPLWINAFVYMTLARMVYFFLPDQRAGPFRAVGMSKWFVWADVVTFLIQGAGGSMTSPGGDVNTIRIGLTVYLAGLGCQEFFILAFVGLMVIFHRKAFATKRTDYGQMEYVTDEETVQTPARRRGWKMLLYALYAVLGFISLRIFYRIGEFSRGITPSNPIPFHEAYSYALDAFPMMACLLIMAVIHPGRTLVGPASDLPRKTRAAKKAEKQQKKHEK